MAGDKMQRSLEVQRDESVRRIDTERQARKGEIAQKSREKVSEVQTGFEMKLQEMEASKAGLDGKIASLESALSNMPAGHPERSKLEASLNNLRKYKSNLQIQINILKSRMRSQMQMVKFQFKMQEQIVDIKLSEQKSYLLREFADRIMTLRQNQMQMARMQQMQQGKSSALSAEARREQGSASG